MEAQMTVLRQMDARLAAEHGLTLTDYEVLLRLSHAPDRRMRRVDIAHGISRTQSGVTRLLRGLEDAGYVRRAVCESDARVAYAELTDAGRKAFRAAARTHHEDIERHFGQHFDDEELEVLERLLSRVGTSQRDGAPEACGQSE